MTADSLTQEMADHYRAHPAPFTFRVLARMYQTTQAAVYARLWRAGVLPRQGQALFYRDEEIEAAYRRLGSLSAVVGELGISFYVVKDALARRNVRLQVAKRPSKVTEAQVRDAIQALRPEVEWKGIAHRLDIAPQTLWKYRRRLESSTSALEVRDTDDASGSDGDGSARNSLHPETRRHAPAVGLRLGGGLLSALHTETVGGRGGLSDRR